MQWCVKVLRYVREHFYSYSRFSFRIRQIISSAECPTCKQRQLWHKLHSSSIILTWVVAVFSVTSRSKSLSGNCVSSLWPMSKWFVTLLTVSAHSFIPGCRSTRTVSSRRLLNKPLLIATLLVSFTTGSTTGALAPIALFCFTSSFKNTMFVWICIFYRSLSQMEQYASRSCWRCLWLQNKVMVSRGRGWSSPLFNLWTGLASTEPPHIIKLAEN